LLELTSWANKNGFTIHTSKGKTEIMFLSKRKFIGPLPAFKLGSANINVTESVKCLGVHIDNNLDWSVHAKKVIKSFRTKLIKLFSMRFLHPPELSEIYFKGILPSVLYSIAIWGSCSNSIISTLNDQENST